MNPRDPNVQQLQLVAGALQDLCQSLVFVGGCVAGVLITDATRPPVRATQDVDLLAELASKVALYQLQSKLRSLGFQEDPDIYCRWRFKNLKVDVMATEESVMNFTNRWYGEAMTHSVQVTLPDGKSIRQITAPYFIATKLDAFHDRGNGDYMSHDMEDIVNVIDGRAEIIAEIESSAESVRLYLRNEFDDLLADPTFVDSLRGHFQPSALEQQRVEPLVVRLRQIAGL
jgi:predicted nucleotidyltransferase